MPTDPGVVMWLGMMPTLASPTVASPGQFGPISLTPASTTKARAHHVVERDALRDTDDQPDAGRGGLHDGVGREGCRHENAADVGAGLAPRIGDGVVDRDAEVGGAALARADTGDDVGPVGLHLLGVKAAFAPGQTLHQDAAFARQENAHRAWPLDSSTIRRAAAVAVASGVIPASWRSRRPSSSRVPVIRTTSGRVRRRSRVGSMMPCATSSPRVMPPKMLIRMPLTWGSLANSSRALCTTSAFAPPPISRKLAARPPSRCTRSNVFITSPAPLPITPTEPSRRT